MLTGTDEMSLKIDGDAGSVCLGFFNAGKQAGRDECKTESHNGSWDIGYLQGQTDGHRLGRQRGRREAAIAVSVAVLVVSAGVLSRRVGRRPRRPWRLKRGGR